jgi:hypothetical protein
MTELVIDQDRAVGTPNACTSRSLPMQTRVNYPAAASSAPGVGWGAPVAFDVALRDAASERLETAAARYRDESGLRPETTQTEAGPRTEPSSVTNWDSASRMSAAIVGRISSIRSPH